jgi:hypothetical protein
LLELDVHNLFLIAVSNRSPKNVPTIMNIITRITTFMNTPIAPATKRNMPPTKNPITPKIFDSNYINPLHNQVIKQQRIPIQFTNLVSCTSAM